MVENLPDKRYKPLRILLRWNDLISHRSQRVSFKMTNLGGILYVLFLTFANSTKSFASEFPIVDLGYEKHQALVYNVKA